MQKQGLFLQISVVAAANREVQGSNPIGLWAWVVAYYTEKEITIIENQ